MKANLKVLAVLPVVFLLALSACQGNGGSAGQGQDGNGRAVGEAENSREAGEVESGGNSGENSGNGVAGGAGPGGEIGGTGENDGKGDDLMATLLFQGHGSFRITSKDGVVVYVDPYAGEGYDKPADIILVTHQHDDHNRIDLIGQKNPGCTLITNVEALEGGKHNSFSVKGIEIEAVEASNKNHDPKVCVGFIITVDGVKVYASGDTSKTGQMESFAGMGIDYALLPCDGIYNMDLKEAAECAEIIGAKHNIPVHMKPGALFDRALAESFEGPDRLIVEAGEEIAL